MTVIIRMSLGMALCLNTPSSAPTCLSTEPPPTADCPFAPLSLQTHTNQINTTLPTRMNLFISCELQMLSPN